MQAACCSICYWACQCCCGCWLHWSHLSFSLWNVVIDQPGDLSRDCVPLRVLLDLVTIIFITGHNPDTVAVNMQCSFWCVRVCSISDSEIFRIMHSEFFFTPQHCCCFFDINQQISEEYFYTFISKCWSDIIADGDATCNQNTNDTEWLQFHLRVGSTLNFIRVGPLIFYTSRL